MLTTATATVMLFLDKADTYILRVNCGLNI